MTDARSDGLKVATLIDPKVRQRTMGRGLRGTVMRAALCLILVALLFHLLSAAWISFGGRRSHFQAVASGAYMAAHPEYAFVEAACCRAGSLFETSLRLDWVVRTPSGTGQSGSTTIYNNSRGQLSSNQPRIFPSESPLGRSQTGGVPPTKAATRRVLGSLPRSVRAMAVIEFVAPMSGLDYLAKVRSGNGEGYDGKNPVYLTSPYDLREVGPPVSWPTARLLGPSGDSTLRQSFSSWAMELSSSDSHNLRQLGLPPVSTLKRLARRPVVFAFIVDSASRLQLRAFLQDRQIASVNIVAVAGT
jgi:hypothetical protein